MPHLFTCRTVEVNEEEAVTNLSSTEYSATVWLNVRSYDRYQRLISIYWSTVQYFCTSTVIYLQIRRAADVVVAIYLQLIRVVGVVEYSELSLNLTTLYLI